MRLFQQPFIMAGLLVATLSTFLPQQAEAVPSFARQTGMACVSCHAQNFPALNSFGRSFKAQGYTMRGAAPLVEGDDLSMPADLKASVITKLRYNVAENVDGGRGEIQWPDEAALLIGGRAAENIGFLLEAGMTPQEAEVTWDADTNGDGTVDAAEQQAFIEAGHAAGESSGNFLGYKVHTNVTDNLGVVIFGTDALGVGYGMELMNTGMQRSQRPIENRKGFSAYQRLGTGSGSATGLAFVYHTGNLMVNYSHWAPTWRNVNANILGGLAHYLRVNYFVNTSGWDIGLGVSHIDGTVKSGADAPSVVGGDYAETNVAGNGIDFQALGELGGLPAEFYLSYGTAPTDPDGQQYNSGTDDKSAYGLMAKVGVANRTSLYAAYGADDDGTTTTSDTTIGLQYMLAQNAKLELFNVQSDVAGGDFTMLQLFSGF